MPRTSTARSRIVLTRRGRLLRSGIVAAAVLVTGVALVLSITPFAPPENSSPAPGPSDQSPAAPSETETPSAVAEAATPTSTSTDEPDARDEEIVQSGTVGDGTWTTARPVTSAEPTSETVHTYALRVENGIGIDVEETARTIAEILGDDRGWQSTEDVHFQQISDPDQADFTISLASPPTVDQMCLPARTNGLWSCRIGEDVALNSDRWTHMTPTYDDLDEYRAYLVNHEVGHFLGHQHVPCGGDGLAAPVMLQQSIDLQGCRPNAWPTADGEA
ncbi:DUF3152 domain-containing protein [Brachybacterium sp. GCM10030252]|uniref:DUF3152 domain-containing protein n=1 Tax=Brachybacterium sp. GCM10030252 TaxID=3273380 RepID=UPI003621DE3F